MPVSLHEAFVPGTLQILHAVRGLLDKTEAHCTQHNLPEAELIHARLAPDMYDFAYQVKSCATHSAGAVQGVREGHFSPDMSTPPDSFPALKALIDEAITTMAALDEAGFESLSGKQVIFTIGDKLRWEFTGTNFLLSFSQPNFYFHASTAYALLRMKGVAIGKVDYLGALRKTS